MWFPCTGAHPGRNDKSVSFETDEVRPDGVVSELQLGGKLVDGPIAVPKQAKDFSARAFDQPPAPW
jgi:hypothetical protein